MQKKRIQRLKNLDGLRGWAAAFVAMMHFPLDNITHQFALIGNGFLFVDLFFVLSGVVIPYVYNEGFSKKEFFVARVGRLAPLYYATLMFAVALEFIKLSGINGLSGGFQDPNSPNGLLREIFLVHTLPIFGNTSFNPPNWSVAVEFHVYLLFAWFAIYSQKKSLYLWLSCCILSGYFIITASILNDAHNLATARGVLGFSLGVIIFKFWHLASRPESMKYAGDIGLTIIFLYVVSGGSPIFPPAIVMSVGILLMLLGANKMYLSRIFENKFSAILGKYSYTIYMIHFFIAMRFEEIQGFLPTSASIEVLLFISYCFLTFVAAALVYKYFEWPLRNYIRKSWAN